MMKILLIIGLMYCSSCKKGEASRKEASRPDSKSDFGDSGVREFTQGGHWYMVSIKGGPIYHQDSCIENDEKMGEK